MNSDEEMAALAKQEAEHLAARRQEQDDLKAVLDTEAGQRLFALLISKTSFVTSSGVSPHDVAMFEEGERSFALNFLRYAGAIAPRQTEELVLKVLRKDVTRERI